MTLQLGWRKALLCAFAFSSLAIAFTHPDSHFKNSHFKQDRAWKVYRHPALGYCVSYPSRWQTSDAFDGAGLLVSTGATKFSRPSGAIDFAVLSEPPSPDARSRPVSLVEDLQDHLDVLARFERAERMEFLEKRELSFLGSAALFTKNRYYDPQDRKTWVEEILFINHEETLYRLELQCRADELARFEPVFSYLISTFRFDCDAAH
jgi:hypothetical protein